MSEEEKTQKSGLNFEGKDYNLEDLTAEQRHMVGHINDIQQKLNENAVAREQLEAGQMTFINSLRASLAASDEPEAGEAEAEEVVGPRGEE